MLCRRDADESTAFVAGAIDDLRKKGITRNAAGWCPQESKRYGQRPQSLFVTGGLNNPVSSESPKGLYKAER